MADSTDATRHTVRPHFATNRIVRYFHAIRSRNGRKDTCVRPNIAITGLGSLITSQTGCNKNNLINIAIRIPVVASIINIRIIRQTHFRGFYHLFTAIITSRSSRIIYSGHHVNTIRAKYIKLEIEHSSRLLTEIVSHTAWSQSFIVARLVKYAIVVPTRIHSTESRVFELHEDNHLPIDDTRIPLIPY